MTSTPVAADLTLDLFDSDGKPSKPIIVASSRMMALSLKAGGVWCGFVVCEAADARIVPGCTARVKLAFLDADSARSTLPSNASILFGDGVVSLGVLLLREYL